jgi:hypothetical protein
MRRRNRSMIAAAGSTAVMAPSRGSIWIVAARNPG